MSIFTIRTSDLFFLMSPSTLFVWKDASTSFSTFGNCKWNFLSPNENEFSISYLLHRSQMWEMGRAQQNEETLGASWSVLIYPLERIFWHVVMLLLPQHTSGLSCRHLILLLLTRGKNGHFPTCHHYHPASSASYLPNSQRLAVMQGQPLSLNRVKQC